MLARVFPIGTRQVGVGFGHLGPVLSVPVTYTGLAEGDIDVFLGNWMPSMTADIKAYTDDKSVETIATNLEGAGYGLVVPTYAADAGVKSLTDLGGMKDKFNGKIYGIPHSNTAVLVIDPVANKVDFTTIAGPATARVPRASSATSDEAFRKCLRLGGPVGSGEWLGLFFMRMG